MELLRFSEGFATGDSAAFDSPFVIGASVVSVSTVAGDTTDVANGSWDSTAGITGAVSLIGSASLVGTGALSVSGFFSLFSENLLLIVPKMLFRFDAAGRASVAEAGAASVTGAVSVVSGAVSTGSTGATATGSSVAGATGVSSLAASVFSSFLPMPNPPKMEFRFREALRLLRAFFSSFFSSLISFFSSFFSSLISAFSSFFSSLASVFSVLFFGKMAAAATAGLLNSL